MVGRKLDQFVQHMLTTVITTAMGTIIGWLLNSVRTRTEKLHEKTRQEEVEREQNRKMLGELLFYRLTDLHYRYVIQGNPCSAADKQQVDDVYHHYHDELGLNGPGTHMYNEIMEAHQG
nr:MAG TPA: minor structural protein [Caudoviricetes sp.]DAL91247.1 MAG TPA: minor structural protein [Caudoviricetes sp.]